MAEHQERFAPDADFRFVGGEPSLDFVNTADWTERGLERDRFTTYARLLEWARGAHLLRGREEKSLVQLARSHPRLATSALERAWSARTTLQRVLLGLVTRRPDVPALDDLNALVSDAGAHLQLIRRDGRLARGWSEFGQTLDCVLWPVVWNAAELLSSDDAGQLRQCGGEDCGWFFVDRSRNGQRRWCEMSVCGTTAKNRRRARLSESARISSDVAGHRRPVR